MMMIILDANIADVKTEDKKGRPEAAPHEGGSKDIFYCFMFTSVCMSWSIVVIILELAS